LVSRTTNYSWVDEPGVSKNEAVIQIASVALCFHADGGEALSSFFVVRMNLPR
jgi:hypothetical protein